MWAAGSPTASPTPPKAVIPPTDAGRVEASATSTPWPAWVWAAAGAVAAVLAFVYRMSGQTNLERPDVVAFFKTPGMLKSGFQIDADLRDLPAGDYRIFLQGSGGVTCPTHHTLRIQ